MTDNFQPRRILVVKLRHIGDVLLTTPIFSSLKAAFPQAELYACVNEKTDAMLANNPFVQDVFTIPSQAASIVSQVRMISVLRRRKFDLVLDFTGSDRSAILTRLTGAPQRWGYHRVKGFAGRNRLFTKTARRKKDVHVVEQQADLLEQFGIPTLAPRLLYAVRSENRSFVRSLLPDDRPVLHVHPVSRVMSKTWPPVFMAELLNHLSARGLFPVITASNEPSEVNYIAELKKHLLHPMLDLTARLALAQLAALSESAAVFLGVDSAPLHIAAAVGTPVIGIYGPSSELLWGPWCEKKLILSREMDCRLPCQLKSACPHIACLREMAPAMVLPKVDSFISSLKL